MVLNIIFHKQITLLSLFKRMLLGAFIGLLVISFFVFGVDKANPAWGEYWQLRPLILTPIVTAFGILSFYLKDFTRPKSSMAKTLVILLSCLAFLFSLWIGVILGLDGTMWN